jgi:hypothetical protein
LLIVLQSLWWLWLFSCVGHKTLVFLLSWPRNLRILSSFPVLDLIFPLKYGDQDFLAAWEIFVNQGFPIDLWNRLNILGSGGQVVLDEKWLISLSLKIPMVRLLIWTKALCKHNRHLLIETPGKVLLFHACWCDSSHLGDPLWTCGLRALAFLKEFLAPPFWTLAPPDASLGTACLWPVRTSRFSLALHVLGNISEALGPEMCVTIFSVMIAQKIKVILKTYNIFLWYNSEEKDFSRWKCFIFFKEGPEWTSQSRMSPLDLAELQLHSWPFLLFLVRYKICVSLEFRDCEKFSASVRFGMGEPLST